MNTQPYLEHNNLTVNSIDETIRFLTFAMPEFEIRGEGINNGRRWVHIGTDRSYLAINEAYSKSFTNDYTKEGFNHMGFVVRDVKKVAERLLSAGYQRNYPFTEHQFRLRDYFLDGDGNEYEFVEYLTENTDERNSYID